METTRNGRYIRARTVVAWDDQPMPCPPFTVLSLPMLLLVKMRNMASDVYDSMTGKKKKARVAREESRP